MQWARSYRMLTRAYFKRSLQLHREQKIQNSAFWINFFHLLKFLTTFFSHSLRTCHYLTTEKVNLYTFSYRNFWRPFLCHSPSYKYKSTAAHQNFLWPSLVIPPKFVCFRSSHLQSYSYNFTITTAQFTFYSCKWHFTTAEIVISYTLKYALMLTK